MSEWNPSVVLVEKIEKHPNADNLEIATVLGDYPTIIRTGDYKVGDLACYLQIDTILPDTEEYHNLSPRAYEKYEENGEIKQRQIGAKYPIGSVPEKNRILKAKKIRNVYSVGMLKYNNDWINTHGLKVGDSVVELLQLKKWEEEEEDNIPNVKRRSGANAEKAPQGWAIPYYDIEGLRKYIDCLNSNEEIVLNEKIHGKNLSACYDGERLWVKSRNFYKKRDPEMDDWWNAVDRYNLEEKLKQYPMLVFFGELYGDIKGFRYDCILKNGVMPTKIRFFDIYDPIKQRYLDYDDFKDKVISLGLDIAPELYRGPWLGRDEMYKYAEGPTTLGLKHVREGCVLRTVKERFEHKLHHRMQLKLIGEGYTLQK
jgi:RNA ligase (TIGR02306 family)